MAAMTENLSCQNREWSIISKAPDTDFSFTQVSTETRTAAPTVEMPYSIYSSLKYTQKIQLKTNQQNSGLVVAHLKVTFPDTNEEVLRADKRIIDGAVETTLRKTENDSLQGSFRWKFTECSYHFGKRHFAFEIVFYTAENLREPFMAVRSAPFMVYARKPSTPQGGRKRRKLTDSVLEEQPPSKVPRNGGMHPSANELLQQFKNKLFELVQLRNKLDPETQQSALALLVQHFPVHPIPTNFHLHSQLQLPPINMMPNSLDHSMAASGYAAQMASTMPLDSMTSGNRTDEQNKQNSQGNISSEDNQNSNENEDNKDGSPVSGEESQEKQEESPCAENDKQSTTADTTSQEQSSNESKDLSNNTSNGNSDTDNKNSDTDEASPHSPKVDVGDADMTPVSADMIPQSATSFGVVRRN